MQSLSLKRLRRLNVKLLMVCVVADLTVFTVAELVCGRIGLWPNHPVSSVTIEILKLSPQVFLL